MHRDRDCRTRARRSNAFAGSIAALAGVMLPSCGGRLESYAPPPQRHAQPRPEPAPSSQYTMMGSPWAEESIIHDIVTGPTKERYRWTGQRPKLQFQMTGSGPWNLVVNFVIADATFRSTGSVRIDFSVNDHLLGPMSCGKPGPYRFQKEVPQEWLPPRGPATVSAYIDRTWTSPDDGAILGFLLIDAGLFPL